MYEYQAQVVRVIDGDTLELSVDLGFAVGVRQIFRLAHVNAPEKNTREGVAVKVMLMERMPVGEKVRVRTQKDRQEKFGRYLCDLFHPPEAAISLNEELLRDGLAKPYEGGKRE